MPPHMFDPSHLNHQEIAHRRSLVRVEDFLIPATHDAQLPGLTTIRALYLVAEAIRDARQRERPVIVFMGAQPIKLGLSLYLRDLIAEGWITHLALTGGALLHDWEIAIHGATSEDVAAGLRDGTYGMWGESAMLNDIVRDVMGRMADPLPFGTYTGQQLLWSHTHGAKVGEIIVADGHGHKAVAAVASHAAYSLLCIAFNRRVDCTVHSQVGADIWHLHEDFPAAAFGRAMWQDFRYLAAEVARLGEGGVFLNLASAVAGPETFLKALAMARNASHGACPVGFTTAVFDRAHAYLQVADPEDLANAPRWYKNVLVRPMLPGAPGHYVYGDLTKTIPALHMRLVNKD